MDRDVENVSVRQSLRTLRGNGPLLVLYISSFCFLTAHFGLITMRHLRQDDRVGA